MKFIHTADLHIGKIINGFSMLEDQKFVLDQILSVTKDEEADGIILAGDIYDRPVPSAEAVGVMDDFLTKLAGMDTAVFIVSGNHDSPERIGFGGRLFEQNHIYIAGEWKSEIQEHVFFDQYGSVHIYLMPFARPSVMNRDMETGCRTYGECVAEAVGRLHPDQKDRNILVTHHFVTAGGKAPELSDSELPLSAMPLAVGGIDSVDSGIFDAFDYVALGHIHGPQKIGKNYFRYAGSPLKYSFSETHHKKSVTVLELGEKGETLIRQRELKPLHDMRIIKGGLTELVEMGAAEPFDREDYIKAVLTDQEELFDPIGVLRAVYPNVMQLVIEKKIRNQTPDHHVRTEMQTGDTLELYRNFFETVTGREMDEKRERVIRHLLTETEEGEEG